MILSADKATLLNKRFEIISKCPHQNKFYLSNFVGGGHLATPHDLISASERGQLAISNIRAYSTHACVEFT